MATEGCMLNPVADCAPNVVSGGAVSVSTLAIPEGACGALVVAVPAVLPFEVADIECMASSSSESDDQLPADDEADSVAPKMEVFRRSEERRVGKECRSGWGAGDEEKKRV